jgi:hypothetical protein
MLFLKTAPQEHVKVLVKNCVQHLGHLLIKYSFQYSYLIMFNLRSVISLPDLIPFVE